jgi:uncharacterized protein YukE
MAPIKVDTDLLKRIATRLELLSREYEKLGTELAVRSNQVPSYGGQLSAPAHKAGTVAQYEANTVRNMLKEHADRLFEIARKFEQVDGETVEQINSWDLLIQNLGGLISKPGPNPFLDIDIEALFGKYHQNQGNSARCADFSLSMVCNIYCDTRGESTARCDVDKITKYLEAVLIGKFPGEGGGTTPWGVGIGLDSLGIPNIYRADGSLDLLEDALEKNKIIVVSIGKILDPNNDKKTWGHVLVIVGQDGDDFLVLDPSTPDGSGVTRLKKLELLEKWWYDIFHPCWIIG